jgi:PIN domain nuclease of toxin-antitoxin system
VNLLLDTHVFVWWDEENPRLGRQAAAAIANATNNVFVSAASVWEIALARQSGRAILKGSAAEAVARNGFHALPISSAHAERVAELPLLHRDPFDRMLIAQAELDSLTLVTADANVAAYSVAQLWAGRGRR